MRGKLTSLSMNKELEEKNKQEGCESQNQGEEILINDSEHQPSLFQEIQNYPMLQEFCNKKSLKSKKTSNEVVKNFSKTQMAKSNSKNSFATHKGSCTVRFDQEISMNQMRFYDPESRASSHILDLQIKGFSTGRESLNIIED